MEIKIKHNLLVDDEQDFGKFLQFNLGNIGFSMDLEIGCNNN